MDVILFASDNHTFGYLRNVYKELKHQNYKSCFLYMDSSHDLNYDSTHPVDFTSPNPVNSLNVNLPFIPDYLIISKDRWFPEQNVIQEFKTYYPKTKIVYIEMNCYLHNSIEIRMERISQSKPPQNLIDIVFNHSKYSLKNKDEALKLKTQETNIVVGNPYWDNLNINNIERVYTKYKIDKSKTQLLFFSTGNFTRKETFKCFNYISDNIDRDKYQIYFKPTPGEINHPLYKNDYIPQFIINGIDGIIFEQEDLTYMNYICDYHIGNISSVNYGGVLYKKQLVSLHKATKLYENFNNLDFFLSNFKNVRENWTSDFWLKIHNLKSQQEFIDLVNPHNLEVFEETNKNWAKVLKNNTHTFDYTLDFLNSPPKNTLKLMGYFNDYNDNKASSRIVDYLKNNLDS
tara:strand:+ start:15906 stop:17111 length:1206 start_codon:yes stop_codon:yes gene_type:complete